MIDDVFDVSFFFFLIFGQVGSNAAQRLRWRVSATHWFKNFGFFLMLPFVYDLLFGRRLSF